jgi:polysaccharide pyruvyl transferase CsaB
MQAYHIGISGSYGGLNLGDEAILEGIVGQLRASIPVKITVFTRDCDDTLRRHQVERAIAIREMTREEARLEIESLDLLILGGGGILYDRDIEMYLREVALASESNIPIVVYAVSAGPINEPKNRELVAKHLSKAAAITVRDRNSIKLLEEIGVAGEIILTADPAILLEPASIPEDILKSDGIDKERRMVGFSVREPGPAAPDIDIEHYHAMLANAADFMIARFDASVIFVPMERKKDDVRHSHAVVSRMQHAEKATVLKGEYTSSQLLRLIGYFQFCIGMRLHFLIFSAHQGIPFFPLPYASKVDGFLQDLDVPYPPSEEITTGGLLAHIDRAWDNREEIKDRIAERLPQLQERARETNRILVRILSETATGSSRNSTFEGKE